MRSVINSLKVLFATFFVLFYIAYASADNSAGVICGKPAAGLSKEKLESCIGDYNNESRNWTRVLTPHFKP